MSVINNISTEGQLSVLRGQAEPKPGSAHRTPRRWGGEAGSVPPSTELPGRRKVPEFRAALQELTITWNSERSLCYCCLRGVRDPNVTRIKSRIILYKKKSL